MARLLGAGWRPAAPGPLRVLQCWEMCVHASNVPRLYYEYGETLTLSHTLRAACRLFTVCGSPAGAFCFVQLPRRTPARTQPCARQRRRATRRRRLGWAWCCLQFNQPPPRGEANKKIEGANKIMAPLAVLAPSICFQPLLFISPLPPDAIIFCWPPRRRPQIESS